MNKDYSYCHGFGLLDTDQPDLCKNCRRNIHFSEFRAIDVERWTRCQYDKNTGKCSMFDKKLNFFDKILSYFKRHKKRGMKIKIKNDLAK